MSQRLWQSFHVKTVSPEQMVVKPLGGWGEGYQEFLKGAQVNVLSLWLLLRRTRRMRHCRTHVRSRRVPRVANVQRWHIRAHKHYALLVCTFVMLFIREAARCIARNARSVGTHIAHCTHAEYYGCSSKFIYTSIAATAYMARNNNRCEKYNK